MTLRLHEMSIYFKTLHAFFTSPIVSFWNRQHRAIWNAWPSPTCKTFSWAAWRGRRRKPRCSRWWRSRRWVAERSGRTCSETVGKVEKGGGVKKSEILTYVLILFLVHIHGSLGLLYVYNKSRTHVTHCLIYYLIQLYKPEHSDTQRTKHEEYALLDYM